jgi:hypothetical protein
VRLIGFSSAARTTKHLATCCANFGARHDIPGSGSAGRIGGVRLRRRRRSLSR